MLVDNPPAMVHLDEDFSERLLTFSPFKFLRRELKQIFYIAKILTKRFKINIGLNCLTTLIVSPLISLLISQTRDGKFQIW